MPTEKGQFIRDYEKFDPEFEKQLAEESFEDNELLDKEEKEIIKDYEE